MLDFDATLAEFAAMNGRPVTVSVGPADGSPPMTVVVATGVLRSGDELSGTQCPHPRMVFYFAFEDRIPTGFFLHREPFEGAEWDGGFLRVRLRSVVLRVEPESTT